jgi:putative hydrolase of the HAD superfamily
MAIAIVGIDGDDTLWTHGQVFLTAEEKISSIVTEYIDVNRWKEEFRRTETHNIKYFGYGVSSYILSVIESVISISGENFNVQTLHKFFDLARAMIEHDVEVNDKTSEIIICLKQKYKLVLITKGQKIEQMKKIERSGLLKLFDSIEIVHEKDEAVYMSILRKHECAPSNFVMIGDSIKSDIVPVLNIGAWAIHLKNESFWHHELAPMPTSVPRFRAVEFLSQVPDVIGKIVDESTT